jgi:hypothetical protein
MDCATALPWQHSERGVWVQFKVFLGTLLRHWLLLLLALAATAAATVFVVHEVGPTFEAKGAVFLFPPDATVQEGTKAKTEGNPYLMLGGLDQVRDIVIHAVTSKATYEDLCTQQADADYEAMRRQLCRRAPILTYEVTPDYTNSTPIILITVDAKSPGAAFTGLQTLMERVPKALVDLQAGLDLRPSATITSRRLAADRTPDVVYKYQIRAGIVAGAGTLALSLLMIGLFDGLMAVRRRPKQPVGQPTRAASEPAGGEELPGLKPVVAGEPVVGELVVAAPVVDVSVAEEVERPLVGLAGEPVAVEPLAEAPVAGERLAEAPVAEAPVAGERMAEAPVAEVPVAGELLAEEPAAEAPVAGEALTEWPVVVWALAEALESEESADEGSGDEGHPDVTRLPEWSQSGELKNTMAASA